MPVKEEFQGSLDFSQIGEAVVIDCETTGLEPESDRVVSVAAVRVDMSKRPIPIPEGPDIFHKMVKPEVPIPAGAQKIHGISDQDVAGCPPFAEIAGELRQFIGNSVLVGHHVQFDKKFLSAEFKRAGQKTLYRNKSFCTMKRMGELSLERTGRWRRWSLDDTLSALSIKGRRGTQHGALEDAMLTAKVAARFVRYDSGEVKIETGRQGEPTKAGRSVGGIIWLVIKWPVALLVLLAIIGAIVGD